MIVMEERPELNVRSGYEADLRVERTDISFHDLAGDRVRIQVTVHNASAHGSSPTPMRLESAPLGVFVPWRPLSRLLVPALEPWESRELSVEVARPRPAPLGDFNRVPPKRLLAAVNPADRPSPPPDPTVAMMLSLLGWRQPGRSAGRDLAGNTALAPDLWDLVGRAQTHWAGNINVFVGQHRVERHLARALRVYPGRANLAMFVVGSPGRPDGYAFELVGLSPDWKTALFNMANPRSLLVEPSDAPIPETRWVESAGGLMVMLVTRPPADCQAGNLEVHVTRRSCGRTAIVEFDLNPAAQGAGCYSL